MSINRKFLLLTALPIAVFVLFIALGWWTLNAMSSTADNVIRRQMLPLVNEDLDLETRLRDSVETMLEADREAHEALLAEKQSLVASSPEETQKADQTSQEKIASARARFARASGAFDEEAKAAYGDFETAFTDWAEKTRKVVDYAQQPAKYKFALRISYGSAAQLFQAMREQTRRLTDLQKARIARVSGQMKEKTAAVEGEVRRMNQTATRMKVTFFALAGVMTLALLGLGTAISRSITRPVNQAVQDLSEVVSATAAASNDVAAASQALAQGSSEQAASLEETSSTMEEILEMTRRNAEHSEQADLSAAEARKLAQKVRETTERLNVAIDAIKKSSDQAATIVRTIDEIAFQTNLLALNAAVEAARAGDAGRGFAVVAEEVRNLAQRAAEAAQRTTAVIRESQTNAGLGVNAVGEVEGVSGGILTAIEQVEALVREVTAASREQTTSVAEVNKAVIQMDRMTQSNAAQAEQTAASSEELSSQSRLLVGVIEAMENLVRGHHNGKAPLPGTGEPGPEEVGIPG